MRVRDEEDVHIGRGGNEIEFDDGLYALGGDEHIEMGRGEWSPLSVGHAFGEHHILGRLLRGIFQMPLLRLKTSHRTCHGT